MKTDGREPPRPAMTLGKTRLYLAVLAGVLPIITGCTNADLERLQAKLCAALLQAPTPKSRRSRPSVGPSTALVGTTIISSEQSRA
jgi:hypothetical protein